MKKIRLNIIFPICIFSILVISMVFVFFLSPAFAQGIENPLKVDSIPGIIGLIVKAILGLVGSATLLMLVWGGFVWLTAAGEEKRVEQGTKTIVWAVLGLGVIFGAYLILDFIIDKVTTEPPVKQSGESGQANLPELRMQEKTLKIRLYGV